VRTCLLPRFFVVYDGSDFTLIGIQLVAVLFIFGWMFTIMGLFFLGLNYLGWLRIDPLEEHVGMDISRHKGSAHDYSVGSAKMEHVQALDTQRLISGNSRHSGSAKVDIPHKAEEIEGGDIKETVEVGDKNGD
jgi:ammonium transporter, Amt family